jgi:hypothetical protein
VFLTCRRNGDHPSHSSVIAESHLEEAALAVAAMTEYIELRALPAATEHLALELADDLSLVPADRVQLQQVLVSQAPPDIGYFRVSVVFDAIQFNVDGAKPHRMAEVLRSRRSDRRTP